MNPEWLDYRKHIWHPYAQEKITAIPLPITSANGVKLKLADGSELIDAISSWWVMCHGHNHPYIKSAIIKQLDVLPHIMFAGLAHEAGYNLAKKIIDIAPLGMSKVFYSDSGSVAVEIALKIALQFWTNQNIKNKTSFISFKNGYHGDTAGAIAVSDNEYHTGFQKDSNHLLKLPTNYDDLDFFEEYIKSVKDNVAALIIEPLVQGTGGMKFYDAKILKIIYNICRENDILFIADEIATGFGRTGSMFAVDQAQICPDIMCIGKALTGGTLPMAATIVTDKIYQAFYSDDMSHAFMHGPTYMGNPLAASAAIASIELFECEPRLKQVEEIEKQLIEELLHCKNSNKVIDVRIKGAIGVVQVDTKQINIFDVRKQLAKAGIWARPFSDVIYVMPPFVISKEDLSFVTSKIVELVL